MKQRVELYKEYDVEYEWFKLVPSYKSIDIKNNKASVEMLLNVDYKLLNVDVESGEYNIKFYFDLKNESGKWKIISIDSDYDLFSNYKEDVMKESKTSDYKSITKSAIDKVYKTKLDDIKSMKKLEADNNNRTKETSNDQVMSKAIYSYSSSNGVSYATRFVGGTTTDVGDLLCTPVESPHNYTNNYNNTWTVSKTGAASIRVHFSRINTENNYDYVTTNAGDSFTGSYSSGIWSSWKSGSSINITLTSDSSITDWGFKIDRVDYRYFYTTGSDCTNFVSQCIWAAYGGYVPGNDTTTRSNISNKVRMVNTGTLSTSWYAGTGGGSPYWEQVPSLWDFATNTAKTYGPQATGYNNNASYANITPSTVNTGNVLQFYNYNYSVYRHSVYVTYKPSSGTITWSNLLVSYHSTDKKNVPVIDLINSFTGPDGSATQPCKMRRMSFSSASFSS